VSELKTLGKHASTVLVGQLAVMAFGVADTMIAGRDKSDDMLIYRRTPTRPAEVIASE